METKLSDLREQLKDLQTEAQEFVGRVDAGETPTADELTRSEAVESEIETIKTQIEALERSDRLRSLYGNKTGKPGPVVKVSKAPTTDDYYNAFRAWAFGGNRNVTVRDSWLRSADLLDIDYLSNEFIIRDQTTDVAGEGKNLLADNRVNRVVEAKAFLSDIEQVATVLPADGTPETFPTVNDTTNTGAYQGGQAESISNTAITFGKVTIPVTTIATAVYPVSFQAIADAPQLIDLCFAKMARRLKKLKQAEFVGGDGTNDTITGLYEDVVSVENGFSNNLTEADIHNVYFGLDRDYLDNAVWMMNEATYAHLLGVKDDETGERIFGFGLNNSPNYTLMGRPIVIVPELDTMASSEAKKPILFGDFSNYFIRQSPVVMVKDDSYSVNKLSSSLFCYQLVGGALVDAGTNPVVALQTGTLSGD